MGVVEVVLTPDDMGHSHEVVIDRDGEVHHGVCDVLLTDTGVGSPYEPECHEVPDCRVGVVDGSLDDDDGLPVLISSGHELLVALHLLLDGKVPAGAGGLGLLLLPPVLRVTGTDVCVSLLHQLLGDVVVLLEPVGLDVVIGDLDAQPLEVLRDHVVCLGVDLLGIGVLEPADQLSAVSLDVLVIEDGYPGVTDVERSGRSGRDPHNDGSVHSVESREFVGPLLLLLLREECRVGVLQCSGLCVQSHCVDLLDDGVDQGNDLCGLASEFGELSQDLTYDRLGVRFPFEEDGVLKCIVPDGILDVDGHGFTDRFIVYRRARTVRRISVLSHVTGTERRYVQTARKVVIPMRRFIRHVIEEIPLRFRIHSQGQHRR